MNQKSIFDPVTKELVSPGTLLKRLIARDGIGRNELHDFLQNSLSRSFGSPTKLSDICADRRQLPLRDLVPLLNSLSLPDGDRDYYTAEFLRAYIEPSLARFVSVPRNDNVLDVLRETNEQLSIDLAYAQTRLLDWRRTSKTRTDSRTKLLNATIKLLKAQIKELRGKQAAYSSEQTQRLADPAFNFAQTYSMSADELLTADSLFVDSASTLENDGFEADKHRHVADDSPAFETANIYDNWKYEGFENAEDIAWEPDSHGESDIDDVIFEDYEDTLSAQEDDVIETRMQFSSYVLKMIRAFISEFSEYQTKSPSSQTILSALLPNKIDQVLIEFGCGISNGVLHPAEDLLKALPKVRSLKLLQKVVLLIWLQQHAPHLHQFRELVNFIKNMQHEAIGEFTISDFKRKKYDKFVEHLAKTFASDFPATISLFSLSSPSFSLKELSSIDFFQMLSEVLADIESYGNVDALIKSYRDFNLQKLSKTLVNRIAYAYCTHVHTDWKYSFYTLNKLEREFAQKNLGLSKRIRLAMKDKSFSQLVAITNVVLDEAEQLFDQIHNNNLKRAESLFDTLVDEEAPSSKEQTALASILDQIPFVTAVRANRTETRGD